jgi:excisionase family DNA binding protein
LDQLYSVSKMTDEAEKCVKLVYGVPEAGAMLGLSRNSSYAAAKRGDLPTIKIGKLIRVPKAAFDRMLAQAGLK